MIFRNADVFTKEGIFQKLDVQIEGGVIKRVGSCIRDEGDWAEDLQGKMLVPGFFDIHTHGVVGCDTCDGEIDHFEKMADFYAKNGVTSFLSTSMSLSERELAPVFETIKEYNKKERSGASIRGINMEGPFFNKIKKGAHDERKIINPDIEMFCRLFERSGEQIKLVDIAPDLEGSAQFIDQAKEMCVVSMAHTMADYDTAMAAIKRGIRHNTHLYNAMPDWKHRQPGAVGAVYDSDITAELICDGQHVHPQVIRSTFRLLGKNRICLISDSLQAAGMPDGKYSLGGQDVYVTGPKATLIDGTIAGSTTTVYHCMKNVVAFGVPLETALLAATINPARAARVDHLIGSISAGKRADLLVLGKDLSLERVYISGKEYKSKG